MTRSKAKSLAILVFSLAAGTGLTTSSLLAADAGYPTSQGDLVPTLADLTGLETPGGKSALAVKPGALTLDRLAVEAVEAQRAAADDPFGSWLTSSAIDPRGAATTRWTLLADRQETATVEPLLRVDASERPLGDSVAVIGSGEAERASAEDEFAASLLPDWTVPDFDVGGLLDRLRDRFFGEGENGSEPAIAKLEPEAPTETVEAPAVEAAPSETGVSLAEVIDVAPAPAFKLLKVAPGTAEAASEFRGTATAGLLVLPSPRTSPESDEPTAEGPTLQALIRSGEDAPKRPAAAPPETRAKTKAKTLAALAVPAPVVRHRMTPPQPRLRPYDAADQGLRLMPGSSADSLARMLKSVSNRPASARGFAPVLTANDRRMRFDEFLKKSQSAGRTMPVVGKRTGAKVSLASPHEMRSVLTSEGLTLQ